MTKDSTKKDKNEEEDLSLSPQKEVKGKPEPADYKKADWFWLIGKQSLNVASIYWLTIKNDQHLILKYLSIDKKLGDT